MILVRFPHASGLRGKKRPAVVVQADEYCRQLRSLIVAEVTSNLLLKDDPACLYVDPSTPEGQTTGLLRASVVSCLVLATIDAATVALKLGELSSEMQGRLDACLSAALSLASRRE